MRNMSRPCLSNEHCEHIGFSANRSGDFLAISRKVENPETIGHLTVEEQPPLRLQARTHTSNDRRTLRHTTLSCMTRTSALFRRLFKRVSLDSAQRCLRWTPCMHLSDRLYCMSLPRSNSASRNSQRDIPHIVAHYGRMWIQPSLDLRPSPKNAAIGDFVV